MIKKKKHSSLLIVQVYWTLSYTKTNGESVEFLYEYLYPLKRNLAPVNFSKEIISFNYSISYIKSKDGPRHYQNAQNEKQFKRKLDQIHQTSNAKLCNISIHWQFSKMNARKFSSINWFLWMKINQITYYYSYLYSLHISRV